MALNTSYLALTPKFDKFSLERHLIMPNATIAHGRFMKIPTSLQRFLCPTATECHYLFPVPKWRTISFSVSSSAFKHKNLSLGSHWILQVNIPTLLAIGSEMSPQTWQQKKCFLLCFRLHPHISISFMWVLPSPGSPSPGRSSSVTSGY